jgi:hypothetical protein
MMGTTSRVTLFILCVLQLSPSLHVCKYCYKFDFKLGLYKKLDRRKPDGELK